MPAPPTEIRIKRKATDDPVELLHVQNEYNGLRQIKQYVFKRQRTSTARDNSVLNPLNPHSVLEQQRSIASIESPTVTNSPQITGASVAYDQDIGRTPGSLGGTVPDTKRTSTDQNSGLGISKQPSKEVKAEPRRFHLSRDSVRNTTGLPPSHIRGAKGGPAVFIERSRVPVLASHVSDGFIPVKINKSLHVLNDLYGDGNEKEQSPSTDNESRPPAPLRNVKLPSGKVVPWNADSETLATQMQAYAMQEIGHKIMKASSKETSTTSTSVIKARQVSSFKTRPLATRNHEQHPENFRARDAKGGLKQDEMMIDAADTNEDDSSYIMETYIRIPVEMIEFEEQQSVGILVLDSQPDLDEFYNDDSDSDDGIYDEEEDENAENHPSTDYPEDEVDSDDEYGRNPYKNYRNRNASDNEEYDEHHITYSDDEDKPPWAFRPWMVNKANHRNETQDDEDE